MNTKRLVIVFVIAFVMIVSAVGIYTWQHDSIMERHWRSQIETATDSQIPAVMAHIAQQDEKGIALLVESLASPREIVARQAKEMIVALLESWEELDVPARIERLELLAGGLADRVATFPPAAREDAVDLVRMILAWQFNDRLTDGTGVLASCDRVLTIVPDRPAAIFGVGTEPESVATTETAAAIDPLPAAETDPANGDDQLLDIFQSLGSGMPGQEPAIEIDSRSTQRAADSRDSIVPRPTDSSDSRLLPGFGTASRPSDIMPGPVAALDANPIPVSALISVSTVDRLRAARESLKPPVAKPAKEPTDAASRFVGIDSWNLMRQLGDEDAEFASLIKAELTRRGFGPLQFELAARLFNENPQVRVELVRMLPRMTSVRATEWLLRLAEDVDAEVRYQALSMLATSSDLDLLARVQEMARMDSEPRTRLLAERIDDRLRR